MTTSRLIVLALNEINFDVVERYAADAKLPGFKRLMSSFRGIDTFAEDEYSHLEPWIQWVSLQTGKRFEEHGVFRLGDIVYSEIPQIFELLEGRGLRVGAVSPMNARNALSRPAYFIPDPWTSTNDDGSAFSRRLADMLRQTVNDNANGRISGRSLVTIVEAILRTASLRLTPRLLALVSRARKQPWLKALVLDQLVHMVHLHLLRKADPDVSFVFLNAGAHIQHHYFFNSPHSGVGSKNPTWYVPSSVDPMLDMLRLYDQILVDYFEATPPHTSLIVATGLTQVPYDKVKYYYRLIDHMAFLQSIGFLNVHVLPRMTRDFEVDFPDEQAASECMAVLSSMVMASDGLPVFGDFQLRGTRLFTSLTYPKEIKPGSTVRHDGGVIADFSDRVAFVAIKNGMHSTKGYAYFSPDLAFDLPRDPVHVSQMFGLISQAAPL